MRQTHTCSPSSYFHHSFPIAPKKFTSAITNLYNKFENIKVNCSMHMSVQSKIFFRSSNLALSAHIVLVEKKKKNCCHKKVTTSPVPFCENSAVRQRRLSPHGTQFECRRGFPAFCLLSTPPLEAVELLQYFLDFLPLLVNFGLYCSNEASVRR